MRIFSTVIFSLVMLQAITGQSVFPTYEDNPTWCVQQSDFGAPYQTFIFKLGKDTTLCDGTYTPILLCPEADSPSEMCSALEFIRFEGKRVYKIDLGCFETLLYDFSLVQGDTLYHRAGSSMYGVVAKEDTIAYNGSLRRTLTIEYPQLFPFPSLPIVRTWIEGIGDLFHPFNSHLCLDDGNCEFSAYVVCFSNEDGVQYGTCTEPCGIENTTTNLNYFQQNVAQLSIVNNPMNLGSPLEIRYVFSENQQGQFYVTNSLGQVLHQQQYQQELWQEGNIRLNWSPQMSGMYWLVWQSNTGQREAISFIVQ